MNTNLNYPEMLRRGKTLLKGERTEQSVRVAIAADHATQQFQYVLASALQDYKLEARIFSGGYNSIGFDVFDPASELHAFRPHFVYLGLSVQQYRERFFNAGSVAQRASLPENYLSEVLAWVDSLLDRGYAVLVNNFALPLERMFGSYGILTSQSLYGSVVAFNQALIQAVKERRNCFINDVNFIAARLGADQFFDERLWSMSKYPCSNAALPHVAASLAAIVAANRGRLTKCLVLDLDNTLWGGVIGDDGMDGIKLGGDAVGEAYQSFQKYILSLKDRGYILAVCSKNTHEVALEVFQKHPEMLIKEEDIALFVANWQPKDGNIEYIARTLNIGLDSLVFVDDSAFERNLVRQSLPDVIVPELPDDVALYTHTLEAAGIFETTGLSESDYERNALYRVEAQRSTEQMKHSSIEDYLRSLDMRIRVEPFTDEELPRVAQLIQRSNQFNLRTQRFSESQCRTFAQDRTRYATLAVRLQDKFGDYGLIAAVCAAVRDDFLFIEELVMSCRVLKRGVEEYMMNELFAICAERGLLGVRGEYIATPKNGLVKDFYRGFDFIKTADEGHLTRWQMTVADYRPRITFIKGMDA